MKESIAAIQNAVIDMKDDDIKGLVQKCLDEGATPLEIIEQGLSKGLDVVGERFDAGDYYLADLIMAGEIVTEAMNLLKTRMNPKDIGRKGKVILATVQGDVHDIGKKIVGMILSASGYEIIDLGVDVSSEKVVEAVKKENIQLVGLSVLLTTMVHNLKEIGDMLAAAGLREKVKIAIGGACCSQHLANEMGVDAFGESAVAAVGIFDDFRMKLGLA
ncbi:MAG: cobalamin-dependent protein [Smithella sp.]|nr:cobalamin-dependent protein [Smithella sp.]